MTKIGLAALARGYASGAQLADLEQQSWSVADLTPDTLLDSLRARLVRGLTPDRPGVFLLPAPDENRTDAALYKRFDDLSTYLNELLPPAVMDSAFAQLTNKRVRRPTWTFTAPHLSEYNVDQYVNAHWRLLPSELVTDGRLTLSAVQYRRQYASTHSGAHIRAHWGRLRGTGIPATVPQVWAFSYVQHFRRRCDPTQLCQDWMAVCGL